MTDHPEPTVLDRDDSGCCLVDLVRGPLVYVDSEWRQTGVSDDPAVVVTRACGRHLDGNTADEERALEQRVATMYAKHADLFGPA